MRELRTATRAAARTLTRRFRRGRLFAGDADDGMSTAE